MTEKEKALIIAQYDKAALELKETTEEAKVEAKKAATESDMKMAAEAFGISQEVAVAEMLMAAPKAVGESFKSAAAKYAPPFSLVMGALGAAGTIAPIIKGLQTIKATRFPGKKGGSGGSKGGNISSASSSIGSIASTGISDLSANNASRLGIDPSLGSGATSDAANRVQGSSSNEIVFSESKYSDFQNQVNFKEEKTTIG